MNPRPQSAVPMHRPAVLTVAAVLAVAAVFAVAPDAATAQSVQGAYWNRPPTVTLTSPVARSVVPIPGTLTLAANAADPEGRVSRVEFYVGSTQVGVDTTAPYSIDISTIPLGFGSFTAKARVYDGSYPPISAESATVPFYVVTVPPQPPRVANPYQGARQYVNPDWARRVREQAAQTPGELGQQMATAAGFPTAVWLDGINAITAGRGLAGHLDEALAQQSATGQPVVVQLVLYNLPNRDCIGEDALGIGQGAPGELQISASGEARYRTEFIDPIVAILGRSAYANLRVVTVIEPGALLSLATGLGDRLAIPECIEAAQTGAYTNGIRYALSRLATLRNAYSYLDISNSGRLGWDDVAGTVPQFLRQIVTESAGPGVNSVAGFATNTADYVPIVEPILTDPYATVNGAPLYQSNFYDWNKIFDETDYAQQMRNALILQGFSSAIGMLIDTGRNGWEPPTTVIPPGDLNSYVDANRTDRRLERYHWCNQRDAGLGERPRANPAAGIHAYVWLKPPGESDGVTSETAPSEPDRPYLRHRDMCHPEGSFIGGSNRPTNALPGAPHYGQWFPEHFAQLVSNAYPPI